MFVVKVGERPVAMRCDRVDHCMMLKGEERISKFDALFDAGRSAVLAGTHQIDSPPVDGGRWGISVILRPDTETTWRLSEATDVVMTLAGGGHWPTGSAGAAHFTVRALEPHRAIVPDDDPIVARYRTALSAAATRARPVALSLRGLTMTPSSVMACAYPADSAADEFSTMLHDLLGDDRWFEEGFHRSIWYATLVHFTGPIARPQALIDWVAEHRDTDLGEARFTEAELIRAFYNGQKLELKPLAVVPFIGQAHGK